MSDTTWFEALQSTRTSGNYRQAVGGIYYCQEKSRYDLERDGVHFWKILVEKAYVLNIYLNVLSSTQTNLNNAYYDALSKVY